MPKSEDIPFYVHHFQLRTKKSSFKTQIWLAKPNQSRRGSNLSEDNFVRSLKRNFGYLFLIVGCWIFTNQSLHAAAPAVEPLEVTMTVSKVSADESKKEILIAAEEAQAGDILVYRAVYHNRGKSTLHEVVATMPIPPSLTYLIDTAVPRPATASKDGRAYFPVGTPPKNTLPAVWRAVRWAPKDLAPDAEFSVELRAQVNGATSAPIKSAPSP